MRKDNLNRALQQPELLSEEQLQELRDTVLRFPYFGAAQIALSQAYHVKGDHRFSDQLSQAAIYTSNRASLYQRLKKPISAAHVIQNAPIEDIASAAEGTPQKLASAIVDDEAAAVTEISPKPIPEETFVALIASVASTTTVDASMATEEPSEPVEEQRHDVDLNSMDPLDAQILVDALHRSIEMEVQPERGLHEHETENSFDIDLTPDDENSYAALIYRRAQRASQEQRINGSDSAESDESEDEEYTKLPAFQSTPLSHGIQRIKTTSGKQHQRNLVDRFIHLEPQIARGKASDYNSGNIAKESLEEDFSFVTETMAVLFAKQGKLDKARKAFRKLMEQHPEKSIYFANQLKNLEHFKK